MKILNDTGWSEVGTLALKTGRLREFERLIELDACMSISERTALEYGVRNDHKTSMPGQSLIIDRIEPQDLTPRPDNRERFIYLLRSERIEVI